MELQRFAREFNVTLEIKQPGWNSDISRWQQLFPPGIQQARTGKFIHLIIITFKIQAFIFGITAFKININLGNCRDVSGYFIFYFILWWNGK